MQYEIFIPQPHVPSEKYLEMTQSLVKTLDWIVGYTIQHQAAPKPEKIADGLNLSRESAIQRIKRLEKLGRVTRVRGRIMPCHLL
jgi:DNA-binding Lrp family transcriptional regulator